MKFASCAEAYAAGHADIRETSVHYSKRLDRDGDGVACEKKDAPAGFVPGVGAYPPPAVDGKPLPVKTHTTGTAVAKPDTPALPQTGPGEITAIGLGLAAAGTAVVLLIRRRRTRYTV